MITANTHAGLLVRALVGLLIVGLLGLAAVALAEEAPKTPPAPAADKPAPSPAPAPTPPPPAEAKPAEAKPTAAKPTEPAKPAEGKPAEARPAEPPKPAEAKPAEAKPAEAKPADTGPPPPSFARLALPAVAEHLALTEEQRGKVAALLKERADAVSKAAAADRPKVIEEYEKKLADVLTDAQRAEWAKSRIEPKLRFNFRFQRWADVLEWFAQQSDLSLVLDAPPPGTFNYSDTREYTPVEAIDLLNGVLLTKGYALIRRGRMLLVLNLKDGIPEGLVPQVDLSDLDARGKFELVTVQFPLGRRQAATVASEITPLLGPYGKIVSLPTTNQVLVTDTAGVMRAINAVIQSISEPPVEPPPKKPEPPPGPSVLAAYPIKPADPKTLMKVLEAMVPGAKVALDEKAEQIHVSATEPDQAKVKALLEQVQAGNPPEKQPRLDVYDIEERDPAATLKTLQGMLPNAQLALDTGTGKLVAWATPVDHETLKNALRKLEVDRSASRTRQLEVYKLTRADPTATLNALETLLPEAKLAIDAKTRSLVAVAVPADQQAIKTMLDQLQPEKPGPDTPELAFYPLKQPPPESLMTVLKNAAPQAVITLEPSGRSLTVLASPADQATIKTLVEQTEKTAPPEEKNQLAIYPVTPAQRTRFQSVLTTVTAELPGIKVITDAEPGELAIWAKPSQHETIKGILEQLKRDVPPAEKYVLVAYPIKSADPASVMKVLQDMFPNVKLVLDAKTSRLLAWTHPAEHESLKASLAQLEAKAPPETQPHFEVYQVRGASAPGLMTSLTSLVPNAKLNIDSRTGNLVVWATPAEHELIQAALGKLGQGGGLESTPQVEVYHLTKADPTTLLALLKSLLPEAQLSVDAATGNLIALAVPADQQTVKALVEQLETEKPQSETPRVVVYQLKSADPTNVATVLGTLFPKVKIVPDKKTRRVTVLATPAEQDTVREAVEQMDGGQAPTDTQEKVMAYPLGNVDPTVVMAILKDVLPDVKVQNDTKAGTIVAWATEADQQEVKRVIERLQGEDTPEKQPRVEAYALDGPATAALVTTLQPMVPKAVMSIDAATGKLLAWATPKEHEALRAALAKLGHGGAGEGRRRAEVYRLTKADPTTTLTLLQSLVPNARLATDPLTRNLVAVASPSEHDTIRTTIEKLQDEGSGAAQRQLAAYPIRGVDPDSVSGLAKGLFPNILAIVDKKGRRVFVWGSAEEQEAFRKSLEQVAPTGAAAGEEKVVTYPLRDLTPSVAIQLLQELLPEVTFFSDPTAGTIIARASQADHETIAQTLQQMQAGPDAAHKPRLVVYPVGDREPTTVVTMLTGLVPKAKLVVDTKARSVAALATPEDHGTIIAAIQKLVGQDAAETLVVYPLKTMSATYAITALAAAVPDARLTYGAGSGQVIAWGRAEDHKKIKSLIEQMEQLRPETMPTTVVYSVGTATATTAINFLSSAFPRATFTAGSDPHQIIAHARPADQEAIKKAVEELSKKEPAETAPRLATYTVESTTATAAMKLLTAAFPNVPFSAGSDPHQIIAYARPAEHTEIEQAIKEMSKKEAEETAARVVAYPVEGAGAASAMKVLAAALPDAQFSIGADPSQLIAYARPADHEVIKAAVAQIEAGAGKPTSQVYRFKSADPKAALAVLTTLVPKATIALDTSNRSLVVSALPEEHLKIKATVDEMDRADAGGQAPTLQLYRVSSGDPLNLVMMLRYLFINHPQVDLSLDRKNDTIVALATPAEHETIRALVDKVEKGAMADPATKVELHSLKNIDSTSALEVIEKVLDKQGVKAELSVDSRSNQLVAIARPEQQTLIRDTLKQLQTEERELEILQLEMVDPSTAEMAIGKLFADGDQRAPEVDSDPLTQQLFVRASRQQLDKIHELLRKMGETGLVTQGGNERMRVIPFQGDVKGALEEIRRIWPQLRANELRMVTPSAVAPMLRRFQTPKQPEPATPPPAKPAEKEEEKAPPKKVGQVERKVGYVEGVGCVERLTSTQTNLATGGEAAADDAAPAQASDAPAEAPSPESKTTPPEGKPTAETAEKEDPQPAPPPIFIIPGEGSITVLCDDPEALQQLESLLRTMSQRPGYAGRDVSVFPVRHTSASAVASTLRQLFRRDSDYSYGYRRSERVMIVPDDRLNTILVQASRADRAKIEDLIQVLDTPQVPATLAAHKPKLIPIKFTRAARIERVIHEVFHAQLSGDGDGSRPQWMAPQVTVDDVTNSLVVTAPPPLIDDITELAETLDKAAEGDRSRSLSVLQLKTTNAESVQEALRTILRDPSRYRRYSQ